MDILLLGPVEATDDTGAPVDLGGPQARALAALLTMHMPDPVMSDIIAESLWPGRPAADTTAPIHVAINRLRTALGRDTVATVGGGYRLGIPIGNLDVSRFRIHARRGRQLQTLGHARKSTESFRQALAQWRGAPLADVRKFEFAERWASQLEEERIAVVEQLMEAELDCGEDELVVGELFGLVDLYPFRERLWYLLMLALYRSGRQAEALRAYGRLRELLGDELGVAPSPLLADLEERILLHDPALVDVSDLERPDWLDHPEHITFAAGDVIVEEGAPADAVYWIESGSVAIVRSGADGEPVRLAELGPGHYFGELASLLGTGRTASAVAVVSTTLTVHNRESFRARLGTERAKETSQSARATELWELIRRGQYLQAHDRAMTLVDGGTADPEVRYLAVLALARSGATVQARRRYQTLGLATVDPSTVTARLAEDIEALAARLDKDMALASTGDARRTWASRSASAYQQANRNGISAYVATNAATMWLVAEQPEAAHAAARTALELLATEQAPEGEGGYWHHVTEAEAALILGETLRANESLERAEGVADGNFASRATTLKQLQLICALNDIDAGILDPIRNPPVIHFCGHRILPPGVDGRFPAADEPRVRAQLSRVLDHLQPGFAFGSLAAGADILAAELLLERGTELQVLLPFSRDEFVRLSVADAGADWVARFDRCLASADHVEITASGTYVDDPVLFDFCSRIAMGEALLRARFLQTNAHQVAVWDGTDPAGSAGTAVDVSRWRRAGQQTTVIPVYPGRGGGGHSDPAYPQHIRAIVFADFAGFSRLSDAQVVPFQERVMGGISQVLEPWRPQILSGRTWGDGLNLILSDVGAAAECALALQAAIRNFDFDAAGLGEIRGIRIAAHVTPVFDGDDPISGQRLFYGAGLTKAARIEPRTPEGEIYTTQAFAALAMLAASDAFDCQYVGTLPTAKGYGALPLFALRHR